MTLLPEALYFQVAFSCCEPPDPAAGLFEFWNFFCCENLRDIFLLDVGDHAGRRTHLERVRLEVVVVVVYDLHDFLLFFGSALFFILRVLWIDNR